MTIAAFRGTCPTCGHDHDADNAEFQRLLKAAPESPAKEQPGEVAGMVKRLEYVGRAHLDAGNKETSTMCFDAAALLAKLGQEWIPVSERMPENFQVVRIRTHEGSELPATCFDATFRVDDQAYGIRWLNKNRITHWLPVPPPPERP